MKRALYMILVLCGLSSCGNSSLPMDNQIVEAKILAIRVENPEVMPGDTVSISLLIGGHKVDQDQVTPVTWTLGIPGSDNAYKETSPYNEVYLLTIPTDILGDEERLEVPVFAEITLGGRSYSAMKRFRITQNPLGMNPEISHITAVWNSQMGLESLDLSYGDTVTVTSETPTLAFTVVTSDLPQGANDTLVYSWYLAYSSNSFGIIEVDDTPAHVEALLGEGALASEFRASMVVSLFGEDAEEKYQPGRYTIYIVVRDNATNPQSTWEDRLGTDYYYITLEAL